MRARNFEGRTDIVCGVAIYIGFQTFINIGVVSWIFLILGFHYLSLAVVSHHLLTLFTAMGIVLNVSLQQIMLKEMMTCLQMILEDSF
ncbi:MAG: hypothetical protein ACLR7D_00285 [Lachnospira eligens]